MVIFGSILAIVGCVGCLVGEVMLLASAYRRGLGWFFGCMFVPPLWLAFLVLHFDVAVKPLAIIITALSMVWLGSSMAGVQF
jgi:hypothetical protein